jgi:hypothetical protein
MLMRVQRGIGLSATCAKWRGCCPGAAPKEATSCQKMALVQHMSIHIDSCATRETIVVTTCSSVYELIVLRGDRGHILVRGGRDFPKFRRALFIGSMADDGSVAPRTIDIGLRMRFISGNRLFLTSPVRSICRPPASAASTACAQRPNQPGVPPDSHGLATVLTGAS